MAHVLLTTPQVKASFTLVAFEMTVEEGAHTTRVRIRYDDGVMEDFQFTGEQAQQINTAINVGNFSGTNPTLTARLLTFLSNNVSKLAGVVEAV